MKQQGSDPSGRSTQGARAEIATAPVASESDPRDRARKQGEAEAEVVDLNLRLKESRTREKRLLESLEEGREALEQCRQLEHELRLQIEQYASFHRSVERSSAWRFIQFLRGLLGRKW